MQVLHRIAQRAKLKNDMINVTSMINITSILGMLHELWRSTQFKNVYLSFYWNTCLYKYMVVLCTENLWWSFLTIKSLQHLLVLLSECSDYNSQELLQSCLHFSCEAGTQGGGNDNGDAVSQKLHTEAQWTHVKLKPMITVIAKC